MRITTSRARLRRSIIAGAAVLSVVGAGAGVAAAATPSGSGAATSATVVKADHSRDGKLDRSSRDTRDHHADSTAGAGHSSAPDRSIDTRADR